MRGKIKKDQSFGYLNIYRLISAPSIIQTIIHKDKAAADKDSEWMDRIKNDHRFVATVYIEWEE